MKKTHSLQFKFLMTTVSAMLVLALVIGALFLFELDRLLLDASRDLVRTTCQKEALDVNGVFDGMEKAVRILESYVLGMLPGEGDALDRARQETVLQGARELFSQVASHTDGAVAYYLRLNPGISESDTGLFYNRDPQTGLFHPSPLTDLSLYPRDDREHVGWFWEPYRAGQPIWMTPYRNLNTGMLMVSYVIPLYQGELFLGVVGMDFDYTVLTDRAASIRLYQNGFAYLSQDGAVAWHPTLEAGAPEPALTGTHIVSREALRNGMELVLCASLQELRELRREIVFQLALAVLLLTVLFCAIVVSTVRPLVRPLGKLTESAEKLAMGNYELEPVPSDTDEIQRLSAAFDHMTLRLREHNRLQHLLAYRDSLTGLRNTTSYRAWITDFEKSLREGDRPFAVAVLDINYLKQTNDRYGHAAGNKLIIAAARLISDTFKRSPVFRIGGDEFVVILQNRDLEDRQTLLRQLEDLCSREYVPEGADRIPVSIARGLAVYSPGSDSSFLDVFNRADDAMYRHKRSMKGQV